MDRKGEVQIREPLKWNDDVKKRNEWRQNTTMNSIECAEERNWSVMYFISRKKIKEKKPTDA